MWYRKPPNISPGLILVRKPFLMGLYTGELIYGGAYIRGSLYTGELIYGGGGLYTDEIWYYRERKEI